LEHHYWNRFAFDAKNQDYSRWFRWWVMHCTRRCAVGSDLAKVVTNPRKLPLLCFFLRALHCFVKSRTVLSWTLHHCNFASQYASPAFLLLVYL
jgi:hypothetical protein